MRYVVRRSGRKLGHLRDARLAHAIHAAWVIAYDKAEREYRQLFNEWCKLYYSGVDSDKVKAGPEPEFAAPELVTPEGWRVLGNGSYRYAYLSPKGVVYKVNRQLMDEASRGYNYHEMTNILSIREDNVLPPGWAVPDATLYNVAGSKGTDYVIAMPLLDTSAKLNQCYGWGICECAETEGNKRIKGKCSDDVFSASVGLRDLHNDNVFPDEQGTLWVLDVGL